mgnify:CR=1 FL=1
MYADAASGSCRGTRTSRVGMASLSAAWLVWAAAVWADRPDEREGLASAVAEVGSGTVAEAVWQVPRTNVAVQVDGLLDEPAWERALAVELVYETRPAENTRAPVDTVALVTYDERNVYVAFRASDPEPAKIRAHLSDRDTAWSDDFVGVVLDTFNDERRAFEFFVNPLGVQMDSLLDDVTGNEDEAWDAIWSSAGRVTESGYVVELAIPFYSLRFPSGGAAQIWGVDLMRNYPRSDRVRIRSQPEDRDKDCYLCQISKMRGFEEVSSGRGIELVPTLVSTRVDERESETSDELTEGDVDGELGLTGTWGRTPHLRRLGALTHHFSQVEADVAQLDVNTQFALFFPEKRPFFLDGADFFDTPLDAVFTRNVADPDWGAKLTGKLAANGVGVFAAQDTTTNLIFPGSQRSKSGSFDFESLDSVVRYRRDVGESSSLGGIVTSRDGDDYSNLVAGVDGLWRFDDSNSVTFQYLTSQTEYPDQIVEDFAQPAGSFSDEAYQLRFDHDSRNWTLYARYDDIGTDFRADMGFMPRNDYTLLLGGGNHVWWGKEENWWKSFWIGGDWDLTEDQSGQELEKETEVWVQLNGPLQSWIWLDVGRRDRFFDGVEFDGQNFFNSWFEFQPTGALFFGMFASVGDAIDFANTRPAETLVWEPELRYNIGKHIRVNLSHQLQRLDVDGGELFEANLTQLRLVYQFNVRTFARVITQYTDIVRDTSLYEDEVDAQTERLFSQLLFSYKLNPRTVAFVGYSDTRSSVNGASLVQDDRAFFVKIGYSWIL